MKIIGKRTAFLRVFDWGGLWRRGAVGAEGVRWGVGSGLGRGLNLLPRKFLSQIVQFWCILQSFLKLFMSCCLCIKLHIRVNYTTAVNIF